jgi:hypothetical protein
MLVRGTLPPRSMMTRYAHRTLLFMALAMGISLWVPSIDLNELASRTEVPVSEEEQVYAHGSIGWPDTQGLCRYATLHVDQARMERISGPLQVLPEDPTLDVVVPPPEADHALS